MIKYKAYEHSSDFEGMELPLIYSLGHKVTTVNDMLKQFDVQYETPEQQSDLVFKTSPGCGQ